MKTLGCIVYRAAIAFVLALGFGVAPARGADIFSVSYSNNRINRIDADTGALLNSYAPPVPAQSGGGAGLALSDALLFYSSIDAPTIFSLNPASGAVVNSFPSPFGSGGNDGLAFGTSSFGATLFAMDYIANRMYLVNPATGATFTSYLMGFDAIGGTDFNSATGQLYVSDAVGDIRALDPNTGAVLNGLSTGSFQTGVGLAGGRLFTAAQSVPTIFERDPVSGAVLNSFASPGGNVAALAGAPIPEPSCGALAAIAVFALSALRRKVKRANKAPQTCSIL